MTVSALFLTAALAATTPGAAPRSTLTTGPAAPTEDQRQQGEGRPTTSTERPHAVGVGGQLTMGSAGIAAGMRGFFNERVGVNFSAGWYRNASGYRTAPSQGSTFAVMPSFMMMLSKPNLSREVDIRPYVGGGVNYVYSTATYAPVTGVPNYTPSSRSGVGGQVFGGAEMTFRDAKAMTISVEGIYYALPVNYINTNVIDGFNWVLAFHFYLR